MHTNYKATVRACYLGYITQAVVVNLLPLLFVIFQTNYQLSFEKLGRLLLFNFITQLLVDVLCVKIVDKTGYRKLTVTAHFCAFLGISSLAWLPQVLPDAYVGLTISVILFSIGGGIIEVVVSPIVDSVPGEDKAGAMSLLHSFYSWGQMGVVLITTVVLALVGRDLWIVLPIAWSLIPLYNMFRFMRVPLMPTSPEEGHTPLRKLFQIRFFLLMLVVMLCAGAAENVMALWASLFAEKALGITKVMGDILGPCLFAAFMGIGRVFYGIWGSCLHMESVLKWSAVLCIICYAVTVLSPWPLLSLFACALCGLSTSLMWPGTLSLSSRRIPLGGATMFGVLAVFGDLGCAGGTWASGVVSDLVEKWGVFGEASQQMALKCGVAFGVLFPILMLLCFFISRGKKQSREKNIGETAQ